MYLCRRPRDRTPWTLLYSSLPIHSQWQALRSRKWLSVFTCRTDTCVFAPHNIVEIFWNLVSFVGVSRGGYDCHTATLYDLRGISRWEIYRQLNLQLLILFFCRRVSLPNLHATC